MYNEAVKRAKENKKNKKDYVIAVDPGVESVGVSAVYVDSVPVMKNNNTPLSVSVKLGETFKGSERRKFSSPRNRIHHMNSRKKAIAKVLRESVIEEDKTFFQRLKKSSYKFEDKNLSEKNILYVDNGYTDKNFFHEYPTFYHLRKAIIEGKTIPTAKMIYMIFAHATQNRGHFLYNMDYKDIDKCLSFETTFVPLIEHVNYFTEVDLNKYNNSEVSRILANVTFSAAVKYKEIIKMYPEIKSDSFISALFSLICGKKIKSNDIFCLDDEDCVDIAFNNEYENIKDELVARFGEKFTLIELCNNVYNWGQLMDIMQSEK